MGSGKTTTTNVSKTEIPAEIRERGSTITNAAMGSYFDPASRYTSFTSSDPNYGTYNQVGINTTGQLNNYHTQAGQNFTDAGSSYQPYISRADQTVTQANADNQATGVNGPNFNWGTLSQYMNPFAQGVIDQGVNEIGRNLTGQRLQNQSAAAQAGAFGGARHGVIDAEAQRTAADTLQNFVGNQLNTGFNQAVGQYNTDFGQKLQANAASNAAKAQNFGQSQSLAQILANLGQQRQQQQLAAGGAQLNLGNVMTAQEQAQKDNAYSKGYVDQRGYPMDIYERLAAINAMQPVNRTSTTTGTQSTSGGWLGPAIGAVGSIFAASDERAKENIKDVDPEEVLGAFAQVQPKSYTYKKDIVQALPGITAPGPRTGFMAQDLERAFGKKSGPDILGVKTVDMAEVMGNLVAAVHGLEKRTRGLKANNA